MSSNTIFTNNLYLEYLSIKLSSILDFDDFIENLEKNHQINIQTFINSYPNIAIFENIKLDDCKHNSIKSFLETECSKVFQNKDATKEHYRNKVKKSFDKASRSLIILNEITKIKMAISQIDIEKEYSKLKSNFELKNKKFYINRVLSILNKSKESYDKYKKISLLNSDNTQQSNKIIKSSKQRFINENGLKFILLLINNINRDSIELLNSIDENYKNSSSEEQNLNCLNFKDKKDFGSRLI